MFLQTWWKFDQKYMRLQPGGNTHLTEEAETPEGWVRALQPQTHLQTLCLAPVPVNCCTQDSVPGPGAQTLWLCLCLPPGSSGQKTTLLTQFAFKKLFDPTVLFLEWHYGNGCHEKVVLNTSSFFFNFFMKRIQSYQLFKASVRVENTVCTYCLYYIITSKLMTNELFS